MTEGDVQATIRIEAAKSGFILWRNNSGALTDVAGRLVRYGLGNDSPSVNKVLKSSDLIGIGPYGRMLAVECKPSNWKYNGSDRERAQLTFINIVKARGGYACFATCWADVVCCLVEGVKSDGQSA